MSCYLLESGQYNLVSTVGVQFLAKVRKTPQDR